MPRDWYLRETWTEEDRADFESRLARSRSYNRPQYLRVQGFHLAEAGRLREALELLGRVVADYPNSLDVTTALHQIGLIRLRLGETDEGLYALRRSIDRGVGDAE